MVCRSLRLLWRLREGDLFSAVSMGTAANIGYCPLLACVLKEEEEEEEDNDNDN